MLINIEKEGYVELSVDEKIDIVARRVLNKHINAFKELAK